MLILKLEYKSKQNFYSTLFEYHILDKFTKITAMYIYL